MTATIVNDREQAMAHLALANHVRTTNRLTLARIGHLPKADGMRAVAELLRGDMTQPIGSLPVRRLLLAPAYMGPERAQRILWDAQIYRVGHAKNPKVRSFTPTQRRKLAEVMEADAAATDRRRR